jgi:putative phosphotransacetylase
MNDSGISQIVDEVVRGLAGRSLVDENPSKFVVVGVSNRHLHIMPEHADILFGPGKRLTSLRALRQPDQFASKETVSIATSRGVLHNVRLIGPERDHTQVELSRSDAIALGLDPPIRQSGSIAGSAGCVIIGPAGSVVLNHGVILASRHLHCHTSEGEALGLRDKQIIQVKAAGDRGGILDNVLVRVGSAHKLEMHLDTDEANALGLASGDKVELVYRRSR